MYRVYLSVKTKGHDLYYRGILLQFQFEKHACAYDRGYAKQQTSRCASHYHAYLTAKTTSETHFLLCIFRHTRGSVMHNARRDVMHIQGAYAGNCYFTSFGKPYFRMGSLLFALNHIYMYHAVFR